MSTARRLVLVAAAAGVVPLLALLPLPNAEAATKTVSIRSTTFVPADITVQLGTTMQYRNDSGTAVVLRSATTNWAFNEVLAPGATSAAHKPAVTGTYKATASGPGVDSAGTVRVVKSVPSPTSTKTTSPKPHPSTTSPSSHPRTSPPTTTATAPPSTGVASGPPILPGGTPPPSASANPPPSLAPPPTDPPALAGRSAKTLIQPHLVRRLGLPGALSVVLVIGLLVGLGRVLLALAPAPPARERTD